MILQRARSLLDAIVEEELEVALRPEEATAVGHSRHVTEPVTGMSQEKIKVLSLGAGFGTGNMGVDALACGTFSSVLHSFPRAQLFMLDYGKNPVTYEMRHQQSTVSVHVVNLRFSWKVFLRNNIARLVLTAMCIRLLPSAGLRRRLFSRNPYLKHIIEADLVTSIAGGDSFSDIYGLPRLFFVALPQILCLLLNKPLILLPQTYGPFKTRVARAIARYILNRAALILSRGEDGLATVATVLGRTDGRMKFAYDMGLALEPFPPRDGRVLSQLERARGTRPLVGLNVSGLLYCGGYGKKNYFGATVDYRDLVHRVIEYLVTEHKAHVLLIPHVFSRDANTEGDVGDNVACREVASLLGAKYNGSLQTLEGTYDQHEIKYVIGQCDFFVGARMHACIAALSQCIPTVSLAYSWKFLGVMKSLGMESCVVDLADSSALQALEVIDVSFRERKRIRQDLANTVPAIRESVLGLFSDVKVLGKDESSTST